MRALATLLITLMLASVLAGCATPGAPFGPDAADAAVDPGAAGVDLARQGGFSDTHVFPGDYDLEVIPSMPLAAGPYEVLEPEVFTLESAVDGADIPVGLFRPDLPVGEKAPVLVHASPYVWTGMADPEDMKHLAEHRRLVETFGPHGYATAIVPIRGTADAGGCMDLMGLKERADLDQAVTWLATQNWSNGNVGMFGLSYSGGTNWEVAAMGNPHLKTIVPGGAVSDLFHLMYHNGTPEQRGWGRLNFAYHNDGFVDYNPVFGTRSAEHSLEGVMCEEVAKGYAAALHSYATGERDPHGFWAERNLRPLVEANYEGSVFLVHGLQDWNVEPGHAYPWVHKLEAKGVVVKHLLGQWGHGFPDAEPVEGGYMNHRADLGEILLHWFDYWLKEDTTVDLGPRVQVQDSSGTWRSEAAWPPADAVATTFHLAPDALLAAEPSEDTAELLVAPSDHDWLDREGMDDGWACTACPTFTTAPFDEAFRFAGVPKAHVTVTPTGPGGHIAAWLYIVEGGERTPVGWGQMNLRFAAGGEEARDVTPGEPLVARMVLEPMDVVVPEGAALQLEFHQGTYTDHHPSAPTYPVHVHVGGDASTLKVMSFERGLEAFFTPPAMLE